MERETQKGEVMLVLTDTEPAISKRRLLQFEEFLKELSESHEGFLSQRWPQVMGFLITFFLSPLLIHLEEMRSL